MVDAHPPPRSILASVPSSSTPPRHVSHLGAGEVLKRVAYRCVIENDTTYHVEQAPGFKPFRKDVRFDAGFQGIPIGDIRGMELTANPHWGMLARRGFFELSAHDATLLRRAAPRQAPARELATHFRSRSG